MKNHYDKKQIKEVLGVATIFGWMVRIVVVSIFVFAAYEQFMK